MRRPLIVMSPKWILRHKQATSALDELTGGSFQTILLDPEIDTKEVKRLVLCSGKVYYHLLERRQEKNVADVALIRLEQLYPFPHEELDKVFVSMPNIEKVSWCQEEPMNQGAWYSSQHHMKAAIARQNLSVELDYVGREGSSAPASGYMSAHKEEQSRFVDQALNINEE